VLRLLVVAVDDLRGRLESNEGLSWDAFESARSRESIEGREDTLRLLATEGARVWEGPTGILGVFEREDGKGMWWGTESAFRGVPWIGILGVGGGSVGTGFIGGIEVYTGPGLDEFCFRELTDNARDLLADTSA